MFLKDLSFHHTQQSKLSFQSVPTCLLLIPSMSQLNLMSCFSCKPFISLEFIFFCLGCHNLIFKSVISILLPHRSETFLDFSQLKESTLSMLAIRTLQYNYSPSALLFSCMLLMASDCLLLSSTMYLFSGQSFAWHALLPHLYSLLRISLNATLSLSCQQRLC